MHQFDELDDEWRYVTAENREAPLKPRVARGAETNGRSIHRPVTAKEACPIMI